MEHYHKSYKIHQHENFNIKYSFVGTSSSGIVLYSHWFMFFQNYILIFDTWNINISESLKSTYTWFCLSGLCTRILCTRISQLQNLYRLNINAYHRCYSQTKPYIQLFFTKPCIHLVFTKLCFHLVFTKPCFQLVYVWWFESGLCTDHSGTP